MNEWRIIDTGIIDAPINMALDEIILHEVNSGKSPNTLRIMRFAPPCVLLGYNQNVYDEVKVDYCIEHGIPINRRISGGGTIYMEPSTVGWEIVASKDMLPSKSIEEIYKFLCGGCMGALKMLGVDAAFRPHNDIEAGGRKISGTGGTEYGNTFLFHGTVLVNFSLEVMLEALNTPLEKLADKGLSTMSERLTWLSRELDAVPDADEIISALLKSFSSLFGISGRKGSLTEYEKEQCKSRLPYFQSEAWIFGRSHKNKTSESAAYKAPGGLIRVFSVVDRNFISSIIINGDFFAYPSRLIPDLETSLKNCRVSDLENKVAAFFGSCEWHIPGVTQDDFVAAIKAALGIDP